MARFLSDVEKLESRKARDLQSRVAAGQVRRNRADVGLQRQRPFHRHSLSAETHCGRALYEDFYCQRGDAENRLRELKCDLFAKRCSSNLFNANTLRLYLSTFAHIVCIVLRRSLKNTAWAGLQPGTLRLKLLKIGACVTRSARRIHVALSSAYPNQNLFMHVWRRLAPS